MPVVLQTKIVRQSLLLAFFVCLWQGGLAAVKTHNKLGQQSVMPQSKSGGVIRAAIARHKLLVAAAALGIPAILLTAWWFFGRKHEPATTSADTNKQPETFTNNVVPEDSAASLPKVLTAQEFAVAMYDLRVAEERLRREIETKEWEESLKLHSRCGWLRGQQILREGEAARQAESAARQAAFEEEDRLLNQQQQLRYRTWLLESHASQTERIVRDSERGFQAIQEQFVGETNRLVVAQRNLEMARIKADIEAKHHAKIDARINHILGSTVDWQDQIAELSNLSIWPDEPETRHIEVGERYGFSCQMEDMARKKREDVAYKIITAQASKIYQLKNFGWRDQLDIMEHNLDAGLLGTPRFIETTIYIRGLKNR